MEFCKLNNGLSMPRLGLGTYKARGEIVTQAVITAAQAGYRHIDTAAFYDNERAVGAGVAASGVPREAFFLVSKMWPTAFAHPEQALDASLRALGVDYLDGYLLHWPGTDRALRLRAYEAMLKAVDQGKVRALGVSNFTIRHLEELETAFGVSPAMNQVELHPWYPQRALKAYCAARGIAVTAWGPIFRGHIDEAPLMGQLGEKYHKSPVQITLRWHLQRGLAVIPKSANPERIAQNIDVFNFALTEADMAAIDALESGRHFGNDPDTFAG